MRARQNLVVRRSPDKLHRSFDPPVLAALESAAWVAYYRRQWPALLRSAITLSRHTFGLSWPATLWCSWYALRAIQLWAPLPDNDPEGSRRALERFYRIVQHGSAEQFDPATAASLELEWWRVHREHQYAAGPGDSTELAEALARLFSHLYGVPESSVRPAAEQRALAMVHSDRWVREGCRPDSALIEQARVTLVGSYAELLAAVGSRS